MIKFIQYRAGIPAVPTGIDAVTQRFSVEVDEEMLITQDFGSGGGEQDFEAEVGAEVQIELSWLDAAENKSEPYVMNFDVEDTVAPPTPTGFTLEAVGERIEDETE